MTTDEKLYTFGTRIAKRLDYYAHPRTGSHYLWACFTGLLDLVFYENEYTRMPEPVQRLEELNPLASYSLKLREDGVPYQPVFINASANGLHGNPAWNGHPTIVLIRDPFASVYSLFKTATDRWGFDEQNPVDSVRTSFEQYRQFYKAAFALLDNPEKPTLLVRYEVLKQAEDELKRLVEFIGVQPKLSPEIVAYWTNFERMTNEGNRTFYRNGNNDAWKNDQAWVDIIKQAAPESFSEFGYE